MLIYRQGREEAVVVISEKSFCYPIYTISLVKKKEQNIPAGGERSEAF